MDGGFTEWGLWEPCSSSCGPGSQSRTRNCTNPPPNNHGNDCEGPRAEIQGCISGPCPGKLCLKKIHLICINQSDGQKMESYVSYDRYIKFWTLPKIRLQTRCKAFFCVLQGCFCFNSGWRLHRMGFLGTVQLLLWAWDPSSTS